LLVLASFTSSGAGNPLLTQVQDNNSVNWTQAIATQAIVSSYVTYYYLQNCEAGITSATCTYNGGPPGTIVTTITEYSGIATTGALLGSVSNTQTSPGTGTDILTSTNFNVTTQPALIYGQMWNPQNDTAGAAGTGFTNRFVPSNYGGRVEDKRVTATGNTAATFTLGGSGTDTFITFLLAFAESGGGGSPFNKMFFTGTIGLSPLAWVIQRRNQLRRERERAMADVFAAEKARMDMLTRRR